LFGAIVGAFTVNYGKTVFTSYSPETWLFALGALFVIVTLVLPKGLVGLFSSVNKLSRFKKTPAKTETDNTDNTDKKIDPTTATKESV
jgi:urea transport system permease protein